MTSDAEFEQLHAEGWKLAFYQWHESTGKGEFMFRRGPETKTLTRSQPTMPSHEGWRGK